MSALIESGATALDIQKQIGRESISTTFNIYGHLFRDRNEDLARRLADFYRASEGSLRVEPDSTESARSIFTRRKHV